MSEKRLTTQQLASALGVSDARLRRLRLDGRLPGAELCGGTWVFPPALARTGFTKQRPGRKAGK